MVAFGADRIRPEAFQWADLEDDDACLPPVSRATTPEPHPAKGTTRIAECLLQLDSIEESRILRISRTQRMGHAAVSRLEGFLESHFGSVSLVLPAKVSKGRASSLHYVVMDDAEVAKKLLAQHEGRDLAIEDNLLLVRPFTRSHKAPRP